MSSLENKVTIHSSGHNALKKCGFLIAFFDNTLWKHSLCLWVEQHKSPTPDSTFFSFFFFVFMCVCVCVCVCVWYWGFFFGGVFFTPCNRGRRVGVYIFCVSTCLCLYYYNYISALCLLACCTFSLSLSPNGTV